MSGLRKAWNGVVMTLVRPYVYNELPGWGRVYRLFVGGYWSNAGWTGHAPRWARGKLHGYEQRLDMRSWSNREFFFLGRYFDVGNQFLLKAVVGPGDTVIDIGANEGMIALMAARMVGDKGKVIAYEPNPGPRGIMQAALDRNGINWVDVRPYGLSDEAAELPLRVPAINSGEGSFGRPEYESDDCEVVMSEVRIGDVDLADESPRLIKIDVEGFELHVLHGLRGTIARHKPMIVVEMVAKHLHNAGTSPEEVVQELESLGYRGWRLGTSGRGQGLRVTVNPVEITPDLWDDFLWVHQDDPLAGEIPARLARTSM